MFQRHSNSAGPKFVISMYPNLTLEFSVACLPLLSIPYVQLEARLAHFILRTFLRFVRSISTPTVNVSTTHFLAGLASSNLFFTPQSSRIFSEC